MQDDVRGELALRDGDGLDHGADTVRDDPEQAELGKAFREDEKPCEEKQRVPLDFLERELEVVVLGHQEQQHRPEARDVRRVQVRDRVQEEHEDASGEDDARTDQELGLTDRVLLLELPNVTSDVLAEVRLAVVPSHERQTARDHDQDAGAQYLHEVHEVDLVAQSIADDDVRRVSDHRRRAADVSKESQGDEHGFGLDVDGLAEGDDHGRE
mmetsp:Transcript_32424/g.103009  ORF Transcript_32424/g.103009 Transcript_32424/m.103009 type:complete len:212 (+) Transcript_32424:387-1022(+)